MSIAPLGYFKGDRYTRVTLTRNVVTCCLGTGSDLKPPNKKWLYTNVIHVIVILFQVMDMSFGCLVAPMGIFDGEKDWSYSLASQRRKHRGHGNRPIGMPLFVMPWPFLLVPCPAPEAEAVPLPAKLIVSRFLALQT